MHWASGLDERHKEVTQPEDLVWYVCGKECDLMVSNVIANFITNDKNITLKVSIISHDIHIPNIFLIYRSQSFNKKVFCYKI